MRMDASWLSRIVPPIGGDLAWLRISLAVVAAVIVVIAGVAASGLLITGVRVDGTSMEPTLHSGDRIVVGSADGSMVQRFSVVVVGGVLVFGDRGTGKSTAVRALAALLPPMRAVAGCAYACDPVDAAEHLVRRAVAVDVELDVVCAHQRIALEGVALDQS